MPIAQFFSYTTLVKEIDMFELQQEPNSNILFVTAKGNITGDDYEDVLIPAIETTLADFDKIRILIHMGDEFERIEGEAAWDDAKVGLLHFTSFEKCAIVSDKKWIRRSIKLFGFLIPGQVKLFDNARLAEAKDWIAQ
jgi:hypothetical protein